MEIGTLTFKIDVDFTKLQEGLGRVQVALESLNKEVRLFSDGTKTLSKNSDAVAASTSNVRNRQTEATGTTANLGRAIRELTTTYLGNNLVAITLGTTLGNLATTIVSRVVIAVVQSITQFASLRNELAALAGVGTNAASTLSLIGDSIKGTNLSLTDGVALYTRLAQSAQGSLVPLSRVNDIFISTQQSLAKIQEPTIFNSAREALTAFGGLVTALDSALGNISGKIAFALSKIRDGFEYIRSLLGGAGSPTQSTEEMGARLAENENRINEINQALRAQNLTTQQMISLLGERTGLETQSRDLARQIQSIQAMTADQQLNREKITTELNEQLTHEITIGRERVQQQELLNRLFQLNIQLRQAGHALDDQERDAFMARFRQAQAASQFQPIRESLLTQEQAENESYQRRLENLATFLQSNHDMQLDINTLIETENFRHQNALTQIQLHAQEMQLSAQLATGQALVGFLQQFQGKNKAVALAIVAVNTAMSVAQAIQNTAVAASRALSDLGPIAGPPAAAAIEAWGAAQVGLIIAAGAMQGANALKGSTPSLGGSGSGGGSTATATGTGTAPVSLTIEPVDPNAIFTGAALNGLIERINDQARNGQVVLASHVLGG